MKTWLRGGVIGVIIGILILGLTPLRIGWTIISTSFPKLANTSVMIVSGLIFYFLIGTLIGWLIGKFKQKKN